MVQISTCAGVVGCLVTAVFAPAGCQGQAGGGGSASGGGGHSTGGGGFMGGSGGMGSGGNGSGGQGIGGNGSGTGGTASGGRTGTGGVGTGGRGSGGAGTGGRGSGGNGAGTGGTEGSGDGGAGDGGPRATFTALYASIFGTSLCAGTLCHDPGMQKAVNLSSQSLAYSSLKFEVVAGDGSNSALYKLLANGEMPPDPPKLTPGQVEAVRAWIDSGGLNN
ncbi:MAG: hypothetical protein ABJA82_03915 [Myxococcales bacterium]